VRASWKVRVGGASRLAGSLLELLIIIIIIIIIIIKIIIIKCQM